MPKRRLPPKVSLSFPSGNYATIKCVLAAHKSRPRPEAEQEQKIDTILSEQPYLSNVYPNQTRKIGIVFEIKGAEIEYFNLGVNPIFRERYVIGAGRLSQKGYVITDRCIGCGACLKNCPQHCISAGTPYSIQQEHCLHCGSCFENCPVTAVQKQ